jgi:hypothetical protein
MPPSIERPVPADPPRPWVLEGFLERLDEWRQLEQPPDDLLIIITDWILQRMNNPMVGARRAAGFDDLWFAIIPGTHNGTDLVTCTYWIDVTSQIARCSFYGYQSPPFGPA